MRENEGEGVMVYSGDACYKGAVVVVLLSAVRREILCNVLLFHTSHTAPIIKDFDSFHLASTALYRSLHVPFPSLGRLGLLG